VNIIEVRGLVIWVPPETGRLMAGTVFHKGIQDELFLGSDSILAALGDWHDTGKRTSRNSKDIEEDKPIVRDETMGERRWGLVRYPRLAK
jgi:hypothetical protein